MDKKIILITGASSGIGRDAAMMLSAAGHKVYGAARRTNLIPEGVVPLSMDVTDEASIDAALETVIGQEGRIDVLVNNAGFGYFGAIENVSMEDARRQMEVNVFGLASLTRKVLPYMREQGRGRIINVSSVAGKVVLYFGGWYHVSKFAVEAFSDALRIETRPFGIDVVLIEPGAIFTDWGIIAADNLEASSKGTVYEKEALNEAASMRFMYSKMKGYIADPSVVAKSIVRASLSRRPKVRYHPGTGANLMRFFHWLLPARWWDASMRLIGRKIV
ncbi:MAG: SDR family NAD(P)-dependent oxidoreductase [Bacteroidales bacterium]|nr:SDR family NAD(P)-dependent oxidoreductase [Bacteroidales bacterium]